MVFIDLMPKAVKSKTSSGKGTSLDEIRHSLAHLLAAAVLKKFPKAKLAIGPVIENGFYYDFLLPRAVGPEDLKEFEKEMRNIARANLPFSGKKITPAAARKMFKGQPFKLELIKEFSKGGKQLTIYSTGDIFTDLCRGGHVKNTKEINPDAFALDKVAGAYWRGDEKNPMLTRIYGLAFATKQELEAYRKMREEAEKRDHKKLGPELELFMFHETSPGMPYWLPKGVILYNELVSFWREEHRARGYQEIVSPLLNKKELYITSGHFEHYWPDMFKIKTEEGQEYGVKAMNCPNAMVVFGSKMRSYRDLPLRLSDTDTLHRDERSGTLNGLLRVREFRQDDAHIFVREEDIGAEYVRVFEIIERFYSIFGMKYSFRLGTRPEKFMGDAKTWNKAETSLKKILKESGKDFAIAEGDGAFYGPKVDILMKDALGREWQMGTVQLDFQQPRRFNLKYVSESGELVTPVAIHRVVYGSLERFIGILIEHFAGAFPLWLAPVQAAVLPVGEKFGKYAEKIAEELRTQGIRAETSEASETLGKRIREAELKKIPYILVVGEREETAGEVNVRHYKRGQEGAVKLREILEKLRQEIGEKSL